MTIDAAAAIPAWTAGKLRNWLSVRHSLPSEAATVLGLYGLYELARGLLVGDAREADHHAHQLVALERGLHLFLEAKRAARRARPAGSHRPARHRLPDLHLAVTAGVLLWLHQRRPAAFAFVRTTILLASALALAGFLTYPTAPPRLDGIGIADTVSNGHVDLNKGLVSSLYNPYAAVPSMHIGCALIVATSLLLQGRRPLVRALGALYPPFVLLVVVATGNHFFFDAATGALVTLVAAATAAPLTPRAARNRISELPTRPEPRPRLRCSSLAASSFSRPRRTEVPVAVPTCFAASSGELTRVPSTSARLSSRRRSPNGASWGAAPPESAHNPAPFFSRSVPARAARSS